jgi:hypothetical protein
LPFKRIGNKSLSYSGIMIDMPFLETGAYGQTETFTNEWMKFFWVKSVLNNNNSFKFILKKLDTHPPSFRSRLNGVSWELYMFHFKILQGYTGMQDNTRKINYSRMLLVGRQNSQNHLHTYYTSMMWHHPFSNLMYRFRKHSTRPNYFYASLKLYFEITKK